jgi:hypothetical protein
MTADVRARVPLPPPPVPDKFAEWRARLASISADPLAPIGEKLGGTPVIASVETIDANQRARN